VAFAGDGVGGAPVSTAEGVAVGELAGVAAHPLEPGRRLAFAMLKVSAAAPGTTLRVGDVDAAVVAPPLAPSPPEGAS